jgi:hypothetical protein
MDETALTKENVLLAIQVLYGGSTEQQNAASSWLNSVVSSPTAWQIAFDLIDSQNSMETQFFAANMVLNKSRREWTRLSSDQKTHLLTVVRQVLI